MDDLTKQSIEELINGYLDGDLSDRHKTELKRLMSHDSKLAQRVDSLKRQKDLVGSLPREKAPEHVIGDIKSRLERNVLLNHCKSQNDECNGRKHLFLRHIASIAAVLLLICGLGFVIWQVVSPAAPMQIQTPNIVAKSVNRTLAISDNEVRESQDSFENIAPMTTFLQSYKAKEAAQVEIQEQVINLTPTAMLNIEVANLVTANKLVSQAIYNNSLLNEVVVRRGNNAIEYKLTTSSKQLSTLLNDVKGLFDLPNTNQMILSLGESQMVVLENVTSFELNEIVYSANEIAPSEIASMIAFEREVQSSLKSTKLIKENYATNGSKRSPTYCRASISDAREPKPQ